MAFGNMLKRGVTGIVGLLEARQRADATGDFTGFEEVADSNTWDDIRDQARETAKKGRRRIEKGAGLRARQKKRRGQRRTLLSANDDNVRRKTLLGA